MPAPNQYDLSVQLIGAAKTYNLVLTKNEQGYADFERTTGAPLNPIIESRGELDYRTLDPKRGITWDLSDFSQGLGPFDWKNGYYYYARQADTRWPGIVIPAPLEVADLTGISISEVPIKRIEVGQDNWIITSTTVYRSVGGTAAWTQVGANGIGWTVGNPTDIVVFGVSGGNPIIAVAMGASTAYQFTVNNGANWTASTKTTNNAKNANYFCVATVGTAQPKVWYVRNQNELYVTFDLTNTGDPIGTTSATIGDNLNDDFTSIIEDKNGVLLIGTIHALYTYDGNNGKVTRSTPIYQHKATSDAGSFTAPITRRANRNFENPVEIEGRIYYPIEDYRIGEWNPDGDPYRWIDGIQPSHVGDAPTLQGAIGSLCSVNNQLWVAQSPPVGTSTTLLPGRSGLLGNYLSASGSDGLYAGIRQQDGTWRWHGTLWFTNASNIFSMRYIWYDQKTNFLYLGNAESTLAFPQRRLYVSPEHPLLRSQVGNILPAADWYLETGIYYQSQPNITKVARFGSGRGRAGGGGLQVGYRTAADDVDIGYTLLDTYTTAALLATGTAFSASVTFRGMRLRFFGQTNGANNVSILYNFQIIFHSYPPLYADLSFECSARAGKITRAGAVQGVTMEQLRTLLNEAESEVEPVTITDLKTGETFAANIQAGSGMVGIGLKRRFRFLFAEVR